MMVFDLKRWLGLVNNRLVFVGEWPQLIVFLQDTPWWRQARHHHFSRRHQAATFRCSAEARSWWPCHKWGIPSDLWLEGHHSWTTPDNISCHSCWWLAITIQYSALQFIIVHYSSSLFIVIANTFFRFCVPFSEVKVCGRIMVRAQPLGAFLRLYTDTSRTLNWVHRATFQLCTGRSKKWQMTDSAAIRGKILKKHKTRRIGVNAHWRCLYNCINCLQRECSRHDHQITTMQVPLGGSMVRWFSHYRQFLAIVNISNGLINHHWP